MKVFIFHRTDTKVLNAKPVKASEIGNKVGNTIVKTLAFSKDCLQKSSELAQETRKRGEVLAITLTPKPMKDFIEGFKASFKS